MSMRKNTHPQNLESAITELEATVTSMESGQLTLDQSLTAYQRGSELLRQCQQILADTEQKIRMLDDTNVLQNFSDDE